MRMARLKYKLAESSAEFIACPSVVFIKQYSDTGNYALFHSGGFGYIGELAMPLDEALEELNAAMNYTKEVENSESRAKVLFEYWKKQYEEVRSRKKK